MSLESLAEECPESWVEMDSKGGTLECKLNVEEELLGLAGVDVTNGGPVISGAAIESFMVCLESSRSAMTSIWSDLTKVLVCA